MPSDNGSNIESSHLVVTEAPDGEAISDNGHKYATGSSNIDKRARLLLPNDLRPDLGENFTACLGESGCLTLYPRKEWRALVSRLDKFPVSHSGRQQYARLILGTAVEGLNCDSGGRFTLPAHLKSLGNLSEDVVVSAMGSWVEVWDEKEYFEVQMGDLKRVEGRLAKVETAKSLLGWT